MPNIDQRARVDGSGTLSRLATRKPKLAYSSDGETALPGLEASKPSEPTAMFQ
jgi:hypothetical protein